MERLDDKTIKVLLSIIDMTELGLNYEQMDYQDQETKKAIMKIINKINVELSTNLSTGKLFIEAYPYADGGCILFINQVTLHTKDRATSKKYRIGFDTPILYAFKDINAIGALSKRIQAAYNHIIIKDSLYFSQSKGEYYLLIYTYFKMDDKLMHLLSEYGTFYGKGSIAQAVVKEHTKEIINCEALLKLSRCI